MKFPLFVFNITYISLLSKKDYAKIIIDRDDKMTKKKKRIIISLISLFLLFCITYYGNEIEILIAKLTGNYISYGIEEVPEYKGKSFVYIDDNKPTFKESDYDIKGELYSKLDYLGRTGVATALVSKATMPTEERESIGMIKPTGWHTVKYDNVDGKYLYNRCHLIGYQLTGENANEKNLITCTRGMNTGIMLEYENKIAAYIEKTSNSVLYRVTPIYKGDNLLASGVRMEALSIEDDGKGISFHIYIFNVQEGININYETGESSLK